jgi:ketosteroid isomerase-like protein
MKNARSIVSGLIATLVLILNVAFAQSSTASSGQGASSTPEEEIRTLTNQLVQADLKTDTAFLEKYLADDYTIVHGDGKLLTKAQEIDSFKTADRHYDSFEIRDQKIHIYGDTAIVRMLVSIKGTVNGKPFSGNIRTLRIWTKQNGQWKAIAAQATRVTSDSQ